MSLLSALTPKGFKENLDAATELSTRMTSVKDKEIIIGLREQLNNFRESLLEATERIKQLEDKLKIKEQLKFDGHVYWLQNDDGTKYGPYCQVCKDDRDKLMYLQHGAESWFCTICKRPFPKKEADMTDEDRRKIREVEEKRRRMANQARSSWLGGT